MRPGHNYMGDIVGAPIDDPQEAVRKITIPLLRAKYNPRIVSYTEMPQVAKALSEFHGGVRVKSGKIRLEYAIDGQMVHEDLYLSIYTNSRNFGNNNIATLWGPAWPPFSLRAAKGKLDDATPQMLAVLNSANGNPAWFADVCYVKDLFQNRMAGDSGRRRYQQRHPPERRGGVPDVHRRVLETPGITGSRLPKLQQLHPRRDAVSQPVP
ncbi:MAG: hypothetical protein FJ303_01500 [Planctomycetes bacterium]|nr:hypothetical protein [Planctomycetota bacterium]